MDKICEELYKIGIVPVIAIDDAKDAAPLAEALIRGGLPAAEVTFRTAAAEDAIRIISEKYPEMIVGAGTVLNAEQADRAKAAGAWAGWSAGTHSRRTGRAGTGGSGCWTRGTASAGSTADTW